VGDEGRWKIEEYRTEQGESPIRVFLSGLEGQPRVNALALIQLARERGNTLRLPHSKLLGEGLHELRKDQVRIFYVFRPGRRIVLLAGLLKKRGDIPPAMVKRLRKMQEEIQ
jgi:hypothetical protein